MNWLEAALLGLVQGLTEFLPISSSGHLVLAQDLLGFEAGGGATLEVLLHLGSALSIVVVFRDDLARLLAAAPALFVPARWGAAWEQNAAFRTDVLVLLSAVPAGVIGILFADRIEALFQDPRLVAGLLMITGVILLATRFVPARLEPLRARSALTMGLAQAVAILPGISRSGSTIAAGLASGVDRQEVGRFAFLMALVPIVGAGLLEARDIAGVHAELLGPFALATAVAFGSGVIALKLLLRFVARGRLHLFAPYCLLVGAVALCLT